MRKFHSQNENHFAPSRLFDRVGMLHFRQIVKLSDQTYFANNIERDTTVIKIVKMGKNFKFGAKKDRKRKMRMKRFNR